ncbi:LysM peptidoglycan-binding domain-containing protein [Paenibacillus sp. J2TS4]|uniref:LysM peptidoglycan-binding domain-containing protein n=1 Tax=Paenibacillus sp. J2TS4 TaxID=2807194 RepID=UPI001B279F4D|nr:LysM peptidoglycan-binding domain-containing protein [Paenibacillus sp. J2TS4]GIP31385.1 hypothetical protein J2TS4_05950 [Paenibacillus sp. J2TS4]
MKIHIVKKGESLYQLSKKYHVDLDKLIEFNPQIADPDKIDVGMKVKIPSTSIPVEQPASDIAHKHIVQQGDTLWKLSQKWGIPLKAMIDANPQLKNPSILMTGQLVYIPKWNPNAPNVSGNDAAHEANLGAQSNVMPMNVPPHKKNTAAIIQEVTEMPLPEMPFVEEEKEEIKEVIEELKPEIEEEKVEKEIIEEKVEKEIIEEKVEKEVIEEKVEKEVIEEKVEKEIIEEKIEKEIIEEKVENINKSENKSYPPEKVEIEQVFEKKETSISPLEKSKHHHAYPSVTYTEHSFEQFNVPAVEAAAEYPGWTQTGKSPNMHLQSHQEWPAWSNPNVEAMMTPFEQANLPQLSNVSPNPLPEYALQAYGALEKKDCGCHDQGHYWPQAAPMAAYPGLESYAMPMANVGHMPNVGQMQSLGHMPNMGYMPSAGHMESLENMPNAGHMSNVGHVSNAVPKANVEALQEKGKKENISGALLKEKMHSSDHWSHEHMHSMGHWPHDGHMHSMGHWPHDGHMHSMGHWPHDGHMHSMGHWPHDGHMHSMGHWPHDGHMHSMGHWPHDGHMHSMGHWPHDGHMHSMGHWPHDGHMHSMGHWPHGGHMANVAPMANVSPMANVNSMAAMESMPNAGHMPMANMQAVANVGAVPNMEFAPRAEEMFYYGTVADPYGIPQWGPYYGQTAWDYSPMTAPLSHQAGGSGTETDSTNRDSENEGVPAEEAQDEKRAEIKKSNPSKGGKADSKASLHSFTRKKKNRAAVKKTRAKNPWINY